jgi:hypothetical protein
MTKSQRLQARTLRIQSRQNDKCAWCNRVGTHGKHCKRPRWKRLLEFDAEFKAQELIRDPKVQLPVSNDDAMAFVVRSRAARFMATRLSESE